jgi:hypothetical protein
VEFATLAWVDWFNTRRLLESIGYVPPAEYERSTICRPPWPESANSPSEIPGTIQSSGAGELGECPRLEGPPP